VTRRLRVLLIGRRFWPHGSIDTAGHFFQLACALRRHGAAVEVLTPRYSSSWPIESAIHEIPVYRPVIAPKRDWSMGRYTRSTTIWLRDHAASYDVMFCDSIREESLAAIEASRSTGCPVIVRSSRWGRYSDPSWWKTSRAARRCGIYGKSADAIIVKSAACQRTLLGEGFAAEKVHRIDPGFAAGPIRTANAKRQARISLGAANSDLVTTPESPVLICPSEMTRDSGVVALVQAARELVARYGDLRLWLLGDGPHRSWIYDTLRGDGIRASIAMPGSFCDVEDLLTAADLYFQPDDEGLEFWLPSVIAAEVPAVVVDSQATRTLIGQTSIKNDDKLSGDTLSGDSVQWCPTNDHGSATPKAVRIAIENLLDDIPAAFNRAAMLRRSLLRTRPQVNAIDSYLSLLEDVVRKATSKRENASMEAST